MSAALNLLVFREGRRCVSGQELKKQLMETLACVRATSSRDQILNALLRAGELECGVADRGVLTGPFERVTDFLAEILLGPGSHPSVEQFRNRIENLAVPEELTISTPEGFAYYGLHPLAYADALDSASISSDRIIVIGIRSIGTTLSAVTCAAARKRGKHATRMTVRPSGYPYNRVTQFTEQQLEAVQNGLSTGTEFLVVDEGPGLSGSSFISVAEALVAGGVPSRKITLLCAHEPDFDSFCSADGPSRARKFRWIAVPAVAHKPESATIFIGAGQWREHLLPSRAVQKPGVETRHAASLRPSSWTNFERAKYLSSTDDAEQRLFKFQGFGHYGEAVMCREKAVAAHGFGPEPRAERGGFISYPRLEGHPMSHLDLDHAVLARLGEYCAFRQKHFSVELRDTIALQHMAEHNLGDFELDVPLSLALERPVIVDGRMQPHEWILLPDGRMLKTDSGGHGDDHFFPGPTDIAWDLAGAIIAWRMNEGQQQAFLECYEMQTGDRASQRIHDYIVAYCVFRCAYSLMAANALYGSDEAARLQRDAELYRGMLVQRTVAAVL